LNVYSLQYPVLHARMPWKTKPLGALQGYGSAWPLVLSLQVTLFSRSVLLKMLELDSTIYFRVHTYSCRVVTCISSSKTWYICIKRISLFRKCLKAISLLNSSSPGSLIKVSYWRHFSILEQRKIICHKNTKLNSRNSARMQKTCVSPQDIL